MDTRYDFSDQCGIVTGPASGIGKAVALLLAESNAGLSLVDRDTSGLEAVTRACEEIGATTPLAVDADVSKENDVRRMVDETLSRFGKIDFLVTSAGILFRTSFADIPMQEWDELMDTNVRGLFMCNQFVVREMLKQGGGTIVNVASVAGRSISLIGGVHYCASKHAVIGITRHMARELCTRGIRANAFCPGATHTPMIHDNMDTDEIKGLEGRIALGRMAEPQEQAKVIAFMLSDSASYLNGACLDSNGGSVML
jgi:NAD(P)-dependent dehydrogenase (short-subunit alcohol dehydrogenase family)